MTEPKKYKIGDWATWTSSSSGTTKTKVAECVAVVPASAKFWKTIMEKFPSEKWSHIAIKSVPNTSRDHESYIFAEPPSPKGVKRKLYWPRVAGLKKIEDPYYVDFKKAPK